MAMGSKYEDFLIRIHEVSTCTAELVIDALSVEVAT